MRGSSCKLSTSKCFHTKKLIQYSDVHHEINTELIQNMNSQSSTSCVLHSRCPRLVLRGECAFTVLGLGL